MTVQSVLVQKLFGRDLDLQGLLWSIESGSQSVRSSNDLQALLRPIAWRASVSPSRSVLPEVPQAGMT